ncbi:MAG: hypothetical protein U0325_12505 [Polyangiales bacterium]
MWRIALLGLLAGCLPAAPPYRCDLAGGDRACDGVPGSRCIEGSCASPVPTSTCASGFAFSTSAATPGRCVPGTVADAAMQQDAVSPDVPSPIDVAVPDAPDGALDPDVVAPTDTPARLDLPPPIDATLPTDGPLADLGDPPRDAPLLDRPGTDAPPDAAPVDVPRDAGGTFSTTPPATVAKVVAGFFHTCARLVDNRVWCWGSNEQGQLGVDASITYAANPVRVGLTDVVDIAAGAFHTCALTLSGEVWCWGRNSERQLGVSSPQFAFAPVRVDDAPSGVAMLATGSSHTCVSTSGAQVWCWGNNTQGAGGTESSSNGPLPPTRVAGVSAHHVVAGDAFTCAGGGSQVWCWGRNVYGEIGPSPTPPGHSASPMVITGALAAGDTLEQLYAGGFSACAQGSQGTRCWGRTDLGAIPSSSATVSQLPPLAVPHYRTAVPTFGNLNQCSVDATDGLRCWGANDLGASGNGSVVRAITPPTAALPFRVQRVEGRPVVGQGASHTCALDSTGVLRCWGARYFGQLGDGRLALVPLPVEVPALRNAAGLTGGRAFTCARRPGSPAVTCVGVNNLGQLGGSSVTSAPLPTTEPVPVTVGADRLNGPPLAAITQVTAGGAHACAITASRAVLCWGYNAQAQVSPTFTTTSVSFGALQAIPGFTGSGVACGVAHTCAVSDAGLVLCWGANDRGESGQTTVLPRVLGAVVPGLTGVTAVDAGNSFTCVRTTAGRVECFGANEFGQCGTGMNLPTSVMAASSSVAAITSGATAITLGAQHACARLGTEVRCWGANHRGQLGAPVADPRFIARATTVAGLGAAEEVRAGGTFTCARVAGRVWCWGSNQRGQLGDGTLNDRAAPAEVLLPRDETFAEIMTGEEHACARAVSGRVYCWGSNHLAQIALSDPLWVTRAEQGAVRWPR